MKHSLYFTSACGLILAAFATSAGAAITVKKASIDEGLITLKGNTDPGAVITLDGGVATATANANGKFDFGALNYVPQSCVVKLAAPGQATVLATVKNCNPIALKSRGEWNDATSYLTDELVLLNGSTWRAKTQVPANIIPSDMNSQYWEVFAKGGPRGYAGAQGPMGPTGQNGNDGATGPTGETGPAGDAGTNGIAGSNVFAGQIQLTNFTGTLYTGFGNTTAGSPGATSLPSPVATSVTGMYCFSIYGDLTVTVFSGPNAGSMQQIGTCTTSSQPPFTPVFAYINNVEISAGTLIAYSVYNPNGPVTGPLSWTLTNAPP